MCTLASEDKSYQKSPIEHFLRAQSASEQTPPPYNSQGRHQPRSNDVSRREREETFQSRRERTFVLVIILFLSKECLA